MRQPWPVNRCRSCFDAGRWHDNHLEAAVVQARRKINDQLTVSGFSKKTQRFHSSLLVSPVCIFKPHNVILAQITPRLHFDDFQRDRSGIGESVHFAERDVG